jgi:hypothetical protein
MSDLKLPSIEGKKELEEFVFHLRGIIEAQGMIEEKALEFDALYERDEEKAAEALADLQVQIFTHLVFHIKKLSRPFIKLSREAFGKLPDDPELE